MASSQGTSSVKWSAPMPRSREPRARAAVARTSGSGSTTAACSSGISSATYGAMSCATRRTRRQGLEIGWSKGSLGPQERVALLNRRQSGGPHVSHGGPQRTGVAPAGDVWPRCAGARTLGSLMRAHMLPTMRAALRLASPERSRSPRATTGTMSARLAASTVLMNTVSSSTCPQPPSSISS